MEKEFISIPHGSTEISTVEKVLFTGSLWGICNDLESFSNNKSELNDEVLTIIKHIKSRHPI